MTYSTEVRGRLEIMARWIPEGSTVLDLGCGTGALESMLPPGCTYIGWDRPEIDLDAREWPELPPHDVAVISGVLEHLERPERVIERMTAPLLLVSYALPAFRMKGEAEASGWASSMRGHEFALAFEAAGYSPVGSDGWRRQSIFKLRRSAC